MTNRELKRLRALPRELAQRKNEQMETAQHADTNRQRKAYAKADEERNPFHCQEKNKWIVECERELNRLRGFIEGIADREIRRMAELYYLRGKTWQQVAWEFGWRDEGTPRKKMKKYLKDSENSDLPDLK